MDMIATSENYPFKTSTKQPKTKESERKEKAEPPSNQTKKHARHSGFTGMISFFD